MQDRIMERFRMLISDGRNHLRSSQRTVSGGTYIGWKAAVENLLLLTGLTNNHPYISALQQAHGYTEGDTHEKDFYVRVDRAVRILHQPQYDLENGLITKLENVTTARVFDDFLDHARHYLDAGTKDNAGVIAGVVFEDTIRRMARDNGFDEAGKKLDSVISALANSGQLTSVEAKRARAAAGVRTSATHAQWDEFTEDDVHATIAMCDNLILKHLS